MSWSRRSLLTALALLLAGCGGSDRATPRSTSPAGSGSPALSGSITVLAAASLTGSFTTLGKQFQAAHPGTTVTFSFGASSTLAQQITNGAPADVFASASAKNMTDVVTAGDAADPRTFANNVAQIAVSSTSASKVTSLADLGRPDVKVALCQPEVPCGALAQKVLANAKVAVKPVTQALDVKSVLATVTSGEVDAGIVYVTDVKAAGTSVAGIAIPPDVNASTSYPIVTVKASKNMALARAFEDYVLSPEGQAVLSQAGFAKP